jgi:hypothetical protein
LAVAQQRLADDVDRHDVLHSDRRDGMPAIAPAHSSCRRRLLERPSAGHLQHQKVRVIGIGDQHRASIAVGVYMDALALDLGDDLGEVADLHGDLAGAGDLGVEDVIGEIRPARDAQMQSGLAVRPPQPDQAHGLALGIDHCGDAVERARERAAIYDRKLPEGFGINRR